MDRDTALEVLGLEPGADAKAIKRAYHKRIKKTKPDRDPEGFRRLREAYERLKSGAPAQPEASPEWSSRRPATQRTLNALAVHRALDEGRFADAHAIVMDPRWADALLDDPDRSYAEVTRRVGLATILDHRPAYELVAATYPEVFRPNDPDLEFLLGFGREWQYLLQVSDVPPEVRTFVAKVLIVAPETRPTLARGLALWFWRDRRSATRALVGLLEYHPGVATLLYQEVRAFDDSIPTGGPIPLSGVPTPNARVRLALIWFPLALLLTTQLAVAAVEGPSIGNAGLALVLSVVGFLALGDPLRHPKFHGKVVDSCLVHDQPPRPVIERLRPLRGSREELSRHAVLDFAFRVGRLARLGPNPGERPEASPR